MKPLFFLSLFMAALISCKKNNQGGIATGEYAGTFERVQANGNKEIGHVSISFTGGTFTGNTDKPRYPAICNGNYTLNGDKINFRNNCVWTADFDWTFILDNQYQLRLNGDSIEMRREYTGQVTDIYRLKKR